MVAANKVREKELELIHENQSDMRVKIKKEKRGPGRPRINQQTCLQSIIEQ
jgi:hypothetical protein